MSAYTPGEALYLLPCDHRSILRDAYLGAHPGAAAEVDAWVREAKEVVLDGLLDAVAQGIDAHSTGLLMDEEYGLAALRRAMTSGIPVFLPVDAGELGPWALQYGDQFAEHVEAIRPDAVTALVSYNPEDGAKARQLDALAPFFSWLARTQYPFLLELQVLPTDAQLARSGSGMDGWMMNERPTLIARAVDELKAAGASPVIWKLEGCTNPGDYRAIAAAAHAGGHDRAVLIVLGAGAGVDEVDGWLVEAAREPACIGFAVGRTVWLDPIAAWARAAIDREEAVAAVSANYRHFCETFSAARRVP